jgi:hypothetical protein
VEAGALKERTMPDLFRLALIAVIAGGLLAAPAAAQAPGATARPEPSPATPGSPDASVAPCGERLELLINSVLSRLGAANPSNDEYRRALDAFKSAAEKVRATVRSACADERSAATVRQLEAAEKGLEAALNSLGPALEKLYASLSDEDKAKLDAFRRQAGVWLEDIWRDVARNFNGPGPEGRAAQSLSSLFRGLLLLGAAAISGRPARPSLARGGLFRSPLKAEDRGQEDRGRKVLVV